MFNYFVTKPRRKDPSSLRIIRKFSTSEEAVRWAERYIFPDDKKLFIDRSDMKRLAIIEYNQEGPITHYATS